MGSHIKHCEMTNFSYFRCAICREKVMCHVIWQDVFQELHIVVSRFDHIAQLPLSLLLPEEVESRSHLHQSTVIRNHHEEDCQEGQHLSRQGYRRSRREIKVINEVL